MVLYRLWYKPPPIMHSFGLEPLNLDLTSHLYEIRRGEIEQIGHPDRVAEQKSEQRQSPPRECTAGFATEAFVPRREVDGVFEIDRAAELFCLAQSGRQVGYLDKAIADGQVPEAIEHLDHLQTIRKTHARYTLEADRERDQSSL